MAEQFIELVVALLPALERIEGRLDRDSGRRFNAFNNIFPANELTANRILTFLLDPTETHGQGDVFLRAFIQRFVPEWSREFDFSRAHSALTGERIDVVISDGRRWLGIENKIFDAQEQTRQAQRYLDELHNVCHQFGYRLLYLSPKGEGPTTFSLPIEARDRHSANLVCAAWGQSDGGTAKAPASILNWLADCRIQCAAENVGWFLKQFSEYVEFVVGRRSEEDMADTAIIALALKSKENLEAALRVGESCDGITRDVKASFVRSIYDKLEMWAKNNGLEWEVLTKWPAGNWIERPDVKDLPILLRKKTWPALVGVGIQSDGPSEIIVGVLGPTEDTWKKEGGEQYFGKHEYLIGQESRNRIAEVIKLSCKPNNWWVYYNGLVDQLGQNISDWRDRKTITRLYSERDVLSHFTAGIITDIAARIGDLVIDAT